MCGHNLHTVIFTHRGNFYPMVIFFTVVIDVWPWANWAMVTNNLKAVTEVAQIDVTLGEALLHRCTVRLARLCIHCFGECMMPSEGAAHEGSTID